MSRMRVGLIVATIALAAIGVAFGSLAQPHAAAPEFVYGMAHADDVDDWAWLAQQGINSVLVSISGDGGGQPFYEAARTYGLKLVVWPIGPGEEDMPWIWRGGNSWDISPGHALLDELVANHDVILGVLSLHEPYWRGGAGAIPSESQKALADKLREYTRTRGFQIDICSLINEVAAYEPLPNQCDWAMIWLHCWDAEGTEEEAKQRVRDARAYINAHDPDMKLAFMIQAFGIRDSVYRMPSYSEMKNLACDLIEEGDLDALFWYCWDNPSAYSDTLANHPELQSVVGDVYGCLQASRP